MTEPRKEILGWIIIALICLLVTFCQVKTTHGQTAFSIDASAWTINPGTVQSIAYPFNGPDSGTATFNFPRSPVPDPNDPGPWYGYVLQPWSGPISGSSLSITYKIKEARESVIFNWMSEASNTCQAPASLRLYFQAGDLYNADGFNRWWSNPVHSELGAGRVTLTVAFDPSQWSETFGRAGNQNPSAFYYTLAHPSYVGFTMGGGCFFGHGVNTTGGKAQFQLLDFSTQ